MQVLQLSCRRNTLAPVDFAQTEIIQKAEQLRLHAFRDFPLTDLAFARFEAAVVDANAFCHDQGTAARLFKLFGRSGTVLSRAFSQQGIFASHRANFNRLLFRLDSAHLEHEQRGFEHLDREFFQLADYVFGAGPDLGGRRRG